MILLSVSNRTHSEVHNTIIESSVNLMWIMVYQSSRNLIYINKRKVLVWRADPPTTKEIHNYWAVWIKTITSIVPIRSNAYVLIIRLNLTYTMEPLTDIFLRSYWTLTWERVSLEVNIKVALLNLMILNFRHNKIILPQQRVRTQTIISNFLTSLVTNQSTQQKHLRQIRRAT
jgi:hypothetical protein